MSMQEKRESTVLNKWHLTNHVAFLVVICLVPSIAVADTCDVPASYPTIQAAVDDFTCTEIFVAAGRFYGDLTIGRTLMIQGVSSTSTTVLGKVMVEGLGTSATLNGLRIEVSPEGLPHYGLVIDGFAESLPDDLVIGSSMFFSDGFNQGNTAAWAATVP